MLGRLGDNQKVTPQAVNKVIDQVNRGTTITATPPLEVTHYAGQTQIRMTERGWMGMVTYRFCVGSSGSSGSALATTHSYTVQEIQQADGGLWALKTGGRQVTATEWTDRPVDLGAVVWVEPFGADDWRFESSSGADFCSSSSHSSGSSSHSSSSSSLSACNCVEVAVPPFFCLGGDVHATTKFLCLENGMLVLHDSNPCSSGTSSAVGMWGDWVGTWTPTIYYGPPPPPQYEDTRTEFQPWE